MSPGPNGKHKNCDNPRLIKLNQDLEDYLATKLLFGRSPILLNWEIILIFFTFSSVSKKLKKITKKQLIIQRTNATLHSYQFHSRTLR